MKTLWKVLLGLALVVPLGAYVAGSLAASAAEDPPQRHDIVIHESRPSQSPTPTRSSSPSSSPSDGVEVIHPEYDDLDDDLDDDHGGDRHGGGDDSSGHGSGGGSGDDSGSGSSGSGSGHHDDHSGRGGGED